MLQIVSIPLSSKEYQKKKSKCREHRKLERDVVWTLLPAHRREHVISDHVDITSRILLVEAVLCDSVCNVTRLRPAVSFPCAKVKL